MGKEITHRDRAVLLMIYDYDGCSRDHIKRRFYSDVADWTFRVRMWELEKAGYIESFRTPSITGVGCGKYFLNLGRKGRQEVADVLDCEVRQLRRPRKVYRAIPADHHFGICDFRLDLELAVNGRDDLILTDWTNERELRGRGELGDRVPDATFTIQYLDYRPREFRLEVDRATITDPTRMIFRMNAMITGEYFRTVLWVVPDEKRLHKMLGWAERAAKGSYTGSKNLWVMIAGDDPLGNVWERADDTELHSLFELLTE